MKRLFCLITLSCFITTKAQLWVENIDGFPDLKTKGVYVVMTDTTSEVNKAYWNIYKKYWTYSPIRFVSYEEMDKYIEPGNYFFTIIRNKKNVGSKRTGFWEFVYSCSLELWEHKGKNKPGLKEEILNGRTYMDDIGGKHITNLAGAYLFSTEEKAFYAGDYKTTGGPYMPNLTFYTECNYAGIDKNGKSLYFNWSEGLLKNYLQGFMWYIAQNKKFFDDYTDIYEKDKMELLKHDTLFIPDFAFTEYSLSNKIKDTPVLVTKNNTKVGIAKEKQNMKIICGEYKHPYKIISSKELSNKLLHDAKPFFYLMYVVDGTFKNITIINSATGENIYFTYSPKIERKELDINGILTSDIQNIKLLPADIAILVAKMLSK